MRDLGRLLQRLSPEQREVLLVCVKELSYCEVATISGVPEGADAKSTLEGGWAP